jgi:hypothetical protein
LFADLLKPAKGVVSPIDVLMLKPSPEIEPFIGMHMHMHAREAGQAYAISPSLLQLKWSRLSN